MRITAFCLICLVSVGCTSMLLGNSKSAEPGAAQTNSKGADEADVDEKISASVRQALNADQQLSQYALNVRTVNGYVVISGTVGSYSARDRAIEIAGGVEGPASVSYRIGVDTRL
jgi:osmotically-inducible protein OsmY